MKVILWGINYSPELTGIAPYNTLLCNFLAERKHEVQVVTSFPYYPAWKRLNEDCGKLYRTDDVDGVAVHRCWHYVPAEASSLKRIIHEASFVLTSFVRLCFLKRPDLYIVVSPPLLLGLAAWLIGVLKKTPFLFHVQDLQPDAAIGLGMLKKGLFTRALYRIEQIAYSKAARISGISHGMIEMFRNKGVADEKITYFPNGVALPKPASLPPAGRFRRKHGLDASTFLAVYSGNLGVKQGLDILLEAARVLVVNKVKSSPSDHSHAASSIVIVICGEGARRAHLEQMIRDGGLESVRLLPLQHEAAYREMLVDADCCLIPQQHGSGAFFFPSKLLTALAFGKPVITVADEESELVRAAVSVGRFGVNIPPDQPKTLARTLREFAADGADLKAYGEASRRFAEQFEIEKVLGDFEKTLRSICRS